MLRARSLKNKSCSAVKLGPDKERPRGSRGSLFVSFCWREATEDLGEGEEKKTRKQKYIRRHRLREHAGFEWAGELESGQAEEDQSADLEKVYRSRTPYLNSLFASLWFLWRRSLVLRRAGPFCSKRSIVGLSDGPSYIIIHFL